MSGASGAERTLLHSLRGWARERPDGVFLDFEDGPPLTFGAFDRRSDALAAGMAGRGVGAGERVFALLRNRPELVIALFAAHKLGAIFWFYTGDAGWLDERGRLHFVDRIPDCIRRRGENISSFEVEQCLNAHPAVAESAVVLGPRGCRLRRPALRTLESP